MRPGRMPAMPIATNAGRSLRGRPLQAEFRAPGSGAMLRAQEGRPLPAVPSKTRRDAGGSVHGHAMPARTGPIRPRLRLLGEPLRCRLRERADSQLPLRMRADRVPGGRVLLPGRLPAMRGMRSQHAARGNGRRSLPLRPGEQRGDMPAMPDEDRRERSVLGLHSPGMPARTGPRFARSGMLQSGPKVLRRIPSGSARR